MNINELAAIVAKSGYLPDKKESFKMIDGVQHYRSLNGEWKPCLYSKSNHEKRSS